MYETLLKSLTGNLRPEWRQDKEPWSKEAEEMFKVITTKKFLQLIRKKIFNTKTLTQSFKKFS